MNASNKLIGLIKQHREIGYLDQPHFDKARKCHDWRNYIPDEVRDAWPQMTVESRVMVYILAEKQANAENWECPGDAKTG